MPHRRVKTPVVALVLLLAGALSACGFNPPTDRINTVAAGVNDRSAKVDALGIRVLSTTPGEGRLIGALANNTSDEAALVDVAGDVISPQGFEPVPVPGADSVNLAAADVTAVQLTGDFVAGDVIPLDLTFDTDETVTLHVPVVKYCGQYTQVPSPSVSAPGGNETTGEGESPSATPTEAETTEAQTTEAETTEDGDWYLCEATDDDSVDDH